MVSKQGKGEEWSTFADNELVVGTLMFSESVVGLDDGAGWETGIKVAIWISRGRRQNAEGALVSRCILGREMVVCRGIGCLQHDGAEREDELYRRREGRRSR